MKTLYLVVPCCNGEEVLGEAAGRLSAKLGELTSSGTIGANSKILFVDDGSKDKTWDIIRGLHAGDSRFSGIRLAHNVGQQNALLAGMMTAKQHADVMISLDADLQDDINVTDRMLLEYANGCDIVYGTKAPIENEKLHRRFLAKSFYTFIKVIGVDMVPHHSSCRLMSRRALDALAQYGEVNLFLPALVPLIGLRSAVVHYEQKQRYAGKTKYSIKKLFALAVEAVTSFSLKPLRFIGALAALVFAAGAGLFVCASVRAIRGGAEGWLFALASVWAAGGVLLGATGVLGEYIGKTYWETKKRPRFFIGESLIENGAAEKKQQAGEE